jgi:hypothetical protein
VNFNRRCLAFGLVAYCVFGLAELSIAQQKREIKPIGCYANLRGEGERVYGYSLQLWSWGRELIGVMGYWRDRTGRPPLGILTEVQFDPETGKISFKAKLTTGLHSCPEHPGVPSHDLLSFQGYLRAD